MNPPRGPAGALAAVLSSLRFVVGRRPWPLERPVVVQFPVNDICDSKCQMCNIWQRKQARELAADEVRQLFSSRLFGRVTAVGLNGGEPTLRHDLAEVADALFDALPRLESLSLITNGLHAERAIRRIDALADTVARRGGRLDVMVSLDGVGAIHDRVRGVSGNFDSAVRVLDHVLARPESMSTRVGCTVIRDNVYALHELLDFCIGRRVYVRFRLGVPNRRLYNLPAPPPKQLGKRTWIDTRPFDLSDEQRWHLGQFLLGLTTEYETSVAQLQFYRSLAAQVLEGAPRRAGCDWQHRGVTVTSRGEVSYCAVQSDILGNGLAADPESLYFDGRSHLESIIASKCDSCAHDYVGPPGGLLQLQLLADRGLRAVGSSLAHTQRSAPVQALAAAKRRLVDPLRFSLSRRSLLRKVRSSAASGSPPDREVLICGWYGTETLGDKAILGAIAGLIQAADPGSATGVCSLMPSHTQITVNQMPELARCRVIGTEAGLALAGRARAVVFGGGPLMAIREMAEMEAMFAAARAAGVPTIVAGCGVGPLGPAPFNRSIRSLLSFADRRIFRDESSRAAAAGRLGVDALADPVCEDPAAIWLRSLPQEDATPRNGKVLALALRDWPYLQYARALSFRRGERTRREFEACTTQALERLIVAEPGLRLLPVPFCTHHVGGDDRLLFWRLIRSSAVLRSACDTSLLGREYPPREYVRRLRAADAVLAMRFHSIVFAATLGLPTVAIDYTLGNGKTHALSAALGIPHFPVDRLDALTLAQHLCEALAGRKRPGQPGSSFAAEFTKAWRDCVPAGTTPIRGDADHQRH